MYSFIVKNILICMPLNVRNYLLKLKPNDLYNNCITIIPINGKDKTIFFVAYGTTSLYKICSPKNNKTIYYSVTVKP
jgi:hypothetical protein